jgi:hypothetical protein
VLKPLEATGIGASRRSSSNGEAGVPINSAHFLGFVFPIVVVVLNNTEGVDPDILEPQGTGETNCVLESSR